MDDDCRSEGPDIGRHIVNNGAAVIAGNAFARAGSSWKKDRIIAVHATAVSGRVAGGLAPARRSS